MSYVASATLTRVNKFHKYSNGAVRLPSGTQIKDIDYERCDFRACRFDGYRMRSCLMEFSRLDALKWNSCALTNTTFAHSDLPDTEFLYKSEFKNVRFDCCMASDLLLSGTRVKKTTFINTCLVGLQLEDCELSDVVFSGCDLRGAEIVGCTFKGVTLSACKMEYTSFIKCKFENCKIISSPGFGSLFYACNILDDMSTKQYKSPGYNHMEEDDPHYTSALNVLRKGSKRVPRPGMRVDLSIRTSNLSHSTVKDVNRHTWKSPTKPLPSYTYDSKAHLFCSDDFKKLELP